MTKISKTVVKIYDRLKLEKKLDFTAIKSSLRQLDDIEDDLSVEIIKSGYEPNLRVYTNCQNLLSVFAEEITLHRDFRSYNKRILNVENRYLPSFPPMSPVTNAYFAYWTLCDFQFGKNKETMTSIFADVGAVKGFGEEEISVSNALKDSCMKFYLHMGFENGFLLLKDILTERVSRCISNSGYNGLEGEIWFVRMVPNIDKIHDFQVVLTTPYIILRNSEVDWISFFQRQGIEQGDPEMELKYQRFMKNNPTLNYWMEYLLDAYVNFKPHSIMLTGIPDISGSKPHELGN